MRYLGVDPGKATGLAWFNEQGLGLGLQIVRGLDELTDWLTDNGPFEVIIYEDFKLFAHKALQQSGSRMETVQAIGILKALARAWKSEVHIQAPGCHKLGQMYGGLPYKGAHDKNHDRVAANHVYYYLVKHGIIKHQGHESINAKKP